MVTFYFIMSDSSSLELDQKYRQRMLENESLRKSMHESLTKSTIERDQLLEEERQRKDTLHYRVIEEK